MRARYFWGPLLVLMLGACAAKPHLISNEDAASAELVDTPFFAQTENHCGPAALATMLVASGVSVATPEVLAPQVFVPGRQGSLQIEMIAAARQFDRIPLRLDSPKDQLHAAIFAGYPVLILQNLAFDFWPRWHYAVVIGYDADQKKWILRSGEERRQFVSEKRLVSSWGRSGFWSFVLAKADSPPDFVNDKNWLEAVIPFERIPAKNEFTRVALESAVRQWPESVDARIALANAHYALGDLKAAIVGLRAAVRKAPDSPIALNNLSYVLAEAGCTTSAMKSLSRLRDVPKHLKADVEATRQFVENKIRARDALPVPGFCAESA